MNIAIFVDAVAVAGPADILTRAKEALFELMRGEAALLARFASLIETFATPNLGVLSTIMATVGAGPDEIDIKKAGTFPIVHGVRTLAIDKGILATPTAARIEALVEGRHPGAGVRTGADQRPARLHGVSAPIPARCAAQRDHGDRGHAAPGWDHHRGAGHSARCPSDGSPVPRVHSQPLQSRGVLNAALAAQSVLSRDAGRPRLPIPVRAGAAGRGRGPGLRDDRAQPADATR